MNRKLNPNWVLAVLAGFALLFFAIFPVSIEIHPITSSAQETPTVEYTLRTVLVILSNRLAPLQKALYIEVQCKSDGTITREKPLRSEPKITKI